MNMIIKQNQFQSMRENKIYETNELSSIINPFLNWLTMFNTFRAINFDIENVI